MTSTFTRAGLAVAAFAALTALATPASANADVEAAVKLLATIPADKAKLEAYCKLIPQMKAAGPDGPASDALDDQFDALLISFGAGFDKVVELSHEFDDASPEGQVLSAGFATVEKACG